MKYATKIQHAAQLACIDVYRWTPDGEFGDIEVVVRVIQHTVFVVFRGSDEGSDWRRNFCFWPTKVKGLGKFHRGYWKQMDQYADDIYQLIPKQHRDKPIVVCGHSKGGAEAQLFFVKHISRVDACFTFGAPKPIRKMYHKLHEQTLRIKTTHYRNPYDLVIKMPPGWEHIGKEVIRKLRLAGESEHPGAVYLDLVKLDQKTMAS